jgi:transposase
VPRRLAIAPHLTVAELEHRYRSARAPVERTHWQVIWLAAGGRACAEVAVVVGYSVEWVRKLIGRWNADGPAALADRRHRNPGGTPLLSPMLHDELRRAPDGPAPDGGLWTGPKVAMWMEGRLGRPVGAQRGWEASRRLGFTPQRPRPRAAQADAAAQRAFIKRGSKARSTVFGGRIPRQP